MYTSKFVYALKDTTDNEDVIRRSASKGMRKVLHDSSFTTTVVLEDNKRGIHKDCWRNKLQQDRYASTTNPSNDGIVAAALCKDRPIHYHIKEFSGIFDAWVCDSVIPL